LELGQRGVVYIGRIPPAMRPIKLRHLLSQYGVILRMYLTPEDPAVVRKRKKYRQTRGVSFIDGWVEFADKKIAKRVALTLNNTQIGGRRRSRYYDDLWSMKYLKGFSWTELTEQIAQRQRQREDSLRYEMSVAKRQQEMYFRASHKANVKQKIESSRRTKREKQMESIVSDDFEHHVISPNGAADDEMRTVESESVASGTRKSPFPRTFAQHLPVRKRQKLEPPEADDRPELDG